MEREAWRWRVFDEDGAIVASGPATTEIKARCAAVKRVMRLTDDELSRLKQPQYLE